MNRARARRRGMLIGAPLLATVVFPPLLGSPAWVLAAGAALCLIAVAIAVHDLTTMLIPDTWTVAIAVVAAAVLVAQGYRTTDILLQAVIAILLGLALLAVSHAYAHFRGQIGIGFGDVKLVAASAMLVGVWGVGLQLMLAATAAGAFVVIRAVRRRRPLRARMRVPFGAFLAPSAVIVWAWFPVS